VAQKNGYHPELVDGFMNLDKEVKIGAEVINPKGALLTLSAQEAVRDIGGKPLLASGIEPDLAALVTVCGLSPEQIVRFEPSGFENIAQWITMLAPLFLLGGIMGAYLEFKAPGFGVAGILSAVCFLLFFGGHYIAGLTGLEMAALFVMGVLCILIEVIFFPGVFFLALGGALMVLAALFFSMVDLYPAQPINFSFDRLQVPMWNLIITFVASAAGVAHSNLSQSVFIVDFSCRSIHRARRHGAWSCGKGVCRRDWHGALNTAPVWSRGDKRWSL
jgi:membrane-bound serine protease (ClpP class)